MKIDPLALWGAFTGTVAVGCQLWQWRADRANVIVEGQISIVNTNRIAVVLVIRAVNVGRRPVRIKEVAALLSKSAGPIAMNGSPELAARLSAKLVSSEICFFGRRGEKAIELSPDGGEHTWEVPISKRFAFLSEADGDEEYGKAYVKLTSGKKIFCKFLLLKDDQWPDMTGQLLH